MLIQTEKCQKDKTLNCVNQSYPVSSTLLFFQNMLTELSKY